MSQGTVDPFGDESKDRMSSGRVSISDRPIEAGVYEWGWVEYRGYGPTGRPAEISVVMFDEPTSRKAMATRKRILTRPRWRSLLACYGPITFGFLAMSFGNLEANGWLGQLALILAGVSGWQMWKYTRAIRSLGNATEVWGNRELENYIAGREFLRALTHRDLLKGDPFAYFNLRSQARELEGVISDTHS